MKFYIAAHFSQKQRVIDIFNLLKSNGHEITVDWTRHEGVSFELRKAKSEIVQEYARKDAEGIRNSDVFVLLSEPAEGRAKYAELCIAIASYLEHSKPGVYVVGEDVTHSIFFFHPAVKQRQSFEEVLNEVNKRTISSRTNGKTER